MLRESVDQPPGLRERKRAASIRHIQSVALDLFDDNGFEKVTIDQVAAAAEASASSVYRYFGTKEGLVLHDEHDGEMAAAVLRHLADHDALDAVLLAVEEMGEAHFVRDAALTRRRLPHLVDVPSVRAAGYLAVDDLVRRFAEVLAEPGRRPSRTAVEARAVAAAVLWGLVGSLLAWYEAGATTSLLDAVRSGLAALRNGGHASGGGGQ